MENWVKCFITLICCLVTFNVYSETYAETYIDGTHRTFSDKELLARQWALIHLKPSSPNEDAHKQVVNVVDYELGGVSSFVVGVSLVDNVADKPLFVSSADLALASREARAVISYLRSLNKELRKNVEAFVIPEDIMNSGWQWVSCAYCQGGTEITLNESLVAERQALLDKIHVLQKKIDLPYVRLRANHVELPLEDGRVVVDATMSWQSGDGEADPGKVRIEFKEVFDSYGNEIPANADELVSGIIKVETEARVAQVNAHIERVGLVVTPRLPTGIIRRKGM